MADRAETLLSIVQKVSNYISAPDVNDIDDEEESSTIAEIAVDIYEEMAENEDFPHLFKLREMVAAGSSSNPTRYQIPADVSRIDNFWFDITDTGDANDQRRELWWKDPADFVEFTFNRSTNSSNTTKFTVANSVELFLIDDAHPQYWTSFDDEFVFLDSWKKTEDTFVPASKSTIYCKEVPELVLANGSVINMPNKLMPTYKARVKQTAMVVLKSQSDPISTQEYNRGKLQHGNNANRRAIKREEGRKRGRPRFRSPRLTTTRLQG